VEIASAAFTGTPALRSEFQVVLDDGTLAQPGHEGDVRYRTPAQCTTYRADGVETPVADDDGWFYPGDRGFLDTKGNITITGRTSDIVNVAGAKVNPLPIESAVEQIDGVEDAACVPLTLPDGLTHLALAISVSNSVAHAAVVSHLESLPRAGRPNIVVDVSEVPRNRNGKIDRLLLSERLTAAVRVTPPS
jgi:acyl-coenzyme A synthetase/AMP-(fatty) acid ligase